MKKPNGFGSVYKMSGRRRRPWRAVVTIGHDKTGKRIRQTLGYYESKKEALTALGVYNGAPYSLERLRFSDIYQKWSDEHYREIGRALQQTYSIAYNHSEALHRRIFMDLRTLDLENCIKASGVAPSVQEKMKLLYNQMYKYALRYDFAQRNYAKEVKIAQREESKKRNPFSDDEIRRLWDYIKEDHPEPKIWAAKFTLAGIYSGWRATELCTFRLEGDLMYGGVKTKSGKDRVVPVHPAIEGFAGEVSGSSYKTALKKFSDLMDELGWNHTPHDTRRTFASLASRFGMNENVRKLIMGHVNPDLTERVYTTHTVDELKREIAKIGQI